MSSKLYASLIFTTVSLLLLAVTPSASADLLVKKNQSIYGKVVLIESGDVVINEECGSNGTHVVWNDVRYIEFNDQCSPRSDGDFASPGRGDLGGNCELQARIALSVIRFDGGGTVYAEDVTLDFSGVAFKLPGATVPFRGPAKPVLSISRERVCPEDIPRTFTFPDTFKSEP
jgi:hypothetical protein